MDTMLSKALRGFLTGPLNQLIVNLGGEDGSQWEEEFKKFLRKEPCWVKAYVDELFTITDDPSVKTSEIVARLRQKFSVSVYLEEHLDTDFPAPKKATTRRFKKSVEADPEHAGNSANNVNGLPGITLRERLLMEEMYFDETGQHLDTHTWTICSGSRYPAGGVPCVGWHLVDQKLHVSWGGRGSLDSLARPRLAVS